MKTLFVLFMIGVFQPTSPDYTAQLKKNGHPVMIILKVLETDEECGAWRETFVKAAPEQGVDVFWSKCQGVDYQDPKKVSGS